MFPVAWAAGQPAAGSAAGAPSGQQVVAIKQSDFVLLVLLIVALFYVGAAIIYRLALSPSKDQRLEAARRRNKRD